MQIILEREREREVSRRIQGIKLSTQNDFHPTSQEVHAKWLGEMGWNSLRMESCAPFNRGEIRLNSLCVESNVPFGRGGKWNETRFAWKVATRQGAK